MTTFEEDLHSPRSVVYVLCNQGPFLSLFCYLIFFLFK